MNSKNKLLIKGLALLGIIFVLTACGGGGSGEDTGAGAGAPIFDADNDGRPDVLIETASDARPWQIGLSTGNAFEPLDSLTQTFDSSANLDGEAIALADANGDGRDDVLVQLKTVSEMTEWRVFLSNGTSSTQTIGSVSMPTGDDARALAFADVDADGMADLFLRQQVGGIEEFYVSWSEGAGYSTPELIYKFDTAQGRIDLIALEDINGDGTADLVFDSISRGTHCYFVRLYVGGAFEPQPARSECRRTEDDDSDSVVASPDGTGWGGSQTTTRVEAVGVADMDGDGNSELVFSVTTNNLSIRIFNGIDISQGRAETSWFALNFEDGLSGTRWGNDARLVGITSGQTIGGLLGPKLPESLGLYDMNGDGRPDVVYTTVTNNGPGGIERFLMAFLPDGSGGFVNTQFSTSGFLARTRDDIAIGDFTGDGLPDLLAGGTLYRADAEFNAFFTVENWYDSDPPGSAPFRVVYPRGDGLTSVAQDTGSLIAWAGTDDTIMHTQNEFRELLDGKGLELMPGSMGGVESIKPGKCQAVYASSDNDDLSAEFGALTCLDIDGVTLRQQYIYGGCDLANQGGLGGVGAMCSIGTFRTDIMVNIAGVDQDLSVEGPGAGACAGLSVEFSCVRGGAQLASVSGKTSIGNTGVGAGVSIGLGGGASFGAEDGVLSGVIDLELGIGVSIEFSVDYEATGDFILNHGADAYVFIRDDAGETVISAGEAIIDAVNLINTTGGVVVSGIGEGIEFLGGSVFVAGEEVVDFVDDGIDAIVDFFSFSFSF